MSVTIHTSAGPLKFELFCDRTKAACENFLALCARGAYTGAVVSRVVPGFMFEAAATDGDRSIWAEEGEEDPGFPLELHTPELSHSTHGMLCMAQGNRSRFYVTFAAASHLDGKRTVFGRVLAGASRGTLTNIETAPIDKGGVPRDAITVQRVVIHANPIAEAAL